MLNLTGELREENPELFISATVGTWASPFWTLYADSIWRQGGDTGFHGPGNGRQQWITYRDMFCYRCIVQWGPLYPLNSLMLHGPCIGERTNPARMDRDEKSVADEIWTFFGSGTNLQELYISPHLLTPTMWDELAAAAKWSRANTDVLVDTHWIGGDPGAGDVYGWASWQPRGGIVVLRNPSDKPGTTTWNWPATWSFPIQHLTDYRLKSPRPGQRIGELNAAAVEPVRIELAAIRGVGLRSDCGCRCEPVRRRRLPTAMRRARRRSVDKRFKRSSRAEASGSMPIKATPTSAISCPMAPRICMIDGKRSGVWNGFTWRVEVRPADRRQARRQRRGTPPRRQRPAGATRRLGHRPPDLVASWGQPEYSLANRSRCKEARRGQSRERLCFEHDPHPEGTPMLTDANG